MTGATEALRSFVRGRAGINLGADKDYLVISRLKPLLSGWDVKTLDGLAERLRAEPRGSLADQVIAALTINETLWFRDSKPFEALRTVIIPELVSRKTADLTLSIWSAACSTGQEVYSIAMTLREAEAQLRGLKPTILGSDICEPVLARARSGIYTQFEVQRGLPIRLLVRYFEDLGSEWRVRPELRSGVEFRALNLMDVPPGQGSFDIVFCRNVLLYFEPDTKRKVLATLAAKIKPGGYLALGGAESTLGLTTAFSPLSCSFGLYQKTS
jgi:chemotaxis protein methyltransferase CheR